MENEKNNSNDIITNGENCGEPGPKEKKYTIWRMLFNSLIIAIVLYIVYVFSPLQMVTVSSSSMEPTLPVGSLSLAISTDEDTEYQVGDIVTFSVEYGGTYYARITHRIVAIEGDTIQTKGDNNDINDPFTIHKSQIQNRLKWINIFNIRLPYVSQNTDALTGDTITPPACTENVCDIKE